MAPVMTRFIRCHPVKQPSYGTSFKRLQRVIGIHTIWWHCLIFFSNGIKQKTQFNEYKGTILWPRNIFNSQIPGNCFGPFAEHDWWVISYEHEFVYTVDNWAFYSDNTFHWGKIWIWHIKLSTSKDFVLHISHKSPLLFNRATKLRCE